MKVRDCRRTSNLRKKSTQVSCTLVTDVTFFFKNVVYFKFGAGLGKWDIFHPTAVSSFLLPFMLYVSFAKACTKTALTRMKAVMK